MFPNKSLDHNLYKSVMLETDPHPSLTCLTGMRIPNTDIWQYDTMPSIFVKHINIKGGCNQYSSASKILTYFVK